VCGWGGVAELHAVCDEETIAWHIGLDSQRGDLERLNDDRWEAMIKRPDLWHRSWSGVRGRDGKLVVTPADIFRPLTPNAGYVGLELIPLEPADRALGLWFSDAQHAAVAELAADVWARHGIAPSRLALCGHEDLNPIDRWDAGGGWDPGARRERPRFDWGRVYGKLGL
jgi:N-acetyl-anhydromuramyl-L-alanine amidase AmpD